MKRSCESSYRGEPSNFRAGEGDSNGSSRVAPGESGNIGSTSATVPPETDSVTPDVTTDSDPVTVSTDNVTRSCDDVTPATTPRGNDATSASSNGAAAPESRQGAESGQVSDPVKGAEAGNKAELRKEAEPEKGADSAKVPESPSPVGFDSATGVWLLTSEGETLQMDRRVAAFIPFLWQAMAQKSSQAMAQTQKSTLAVAQQSPLAMARVKSEKGPSDEPENVKCLERERLGAAVLQLVVEYCRYHRLARAL